MLYRAAGGNVRAVGEMERYQRATVLAESILAMRDAIPESGWTETGSVAGFDWRVTTAPYGTEINAPTAIPLHEVPACGGGMARGERAIATIGSSHVAPSEKARSA